MIPVRLLKKFVKFLDEESADSNKEIVIKETKFLDKYKIETSEDIVLEKRMFYTHSTYFDGEICLVRYENDDLWHFKYKGRVMKARSNIMLYDWKEFKP